MHLLRLRLRDCLWHKVLNLRSLLINHVLVLILFLFLFESYLYLLFIELEAVLNDITVRRLLILISLIRCNYFFFVLLCILKLTEEQFLFFLVRSKVTVRHQSVLFLKIFPLVLSVFRFGRCIEHPKLLNYTRYRTLHHDMPVASHPFTLLLVRPQAANKQLSGALLVHVKAH